MSLLGKITTLFADKNSTQPLFPRTVTKAITNEKGEVLDDIMASKSDLPIVCNRNLLDNWYFGNPVN